MGVTPLNVTDEFLVESNPDCADEVGQLMCEAYEYVSTACWEWHKNKSSWFKPSFAFNLAAGYKVGENYWDCH